MDNIIVIITIAFFTVLLIGHIKKEKCFSVLSLCISLYLFSSVCSLLLVNNSDGTYSNYKFLPALYFLLLWLISFVPISRLGHIDKMSIDMPSIKPLELYLWFIAIIGLTDIVSLPTNIQTLVSGIMDDSLFYELYQEKSSIVNNDRVAVHSDINFFSILRGATSHLGIFFTICYLTIKKRNKALMICLIIGIIISPLSSFTTASRGNVTKTLLVVLLSYLIFRRQFEERVRKKILLIIMIVVGVLVVGLLAITISRFTQSFMAEDYVSYSLLSYLGQPILNFNDAVSNTVLRNGDRVIPLFKMLFVPDGYYTYAARMSVYSKMLVDESVFSTYLGEMVLDFGVLGAFLLTGLFSLVLTRLGPKRHDRISISELVIVFVVVYTIVCGWTLSPFSDISGNIKLLFCFLTWIYFNVTKVSQMNIHSSSD